MNTQEEIQRLEQLHDPAAAQRLARLCGRADTLSFPFALEKPDEFSGHFIMSWPLLTELRRKMSETEGDFTEWPRGLVVGYDDKACWGVRRLQKPYTAIGVTSFGRVSLRGRMVRVFQSLQLFQRPDTGELAHVNVFFMTRHPFQ